MDVYYDKLKTTYYTLIRMAYITIISDENDCVNPEDKKKIIYLQNNALHYYITIIIVIVGNIITNKLSLFSNLFCF